MRPRPLPLKPIPENCSRSNLHRLGPGRFAGCPLLCEVCTQSMRQENFRPKLDLPTRPPAYSGPRKSLGLLSLLSLLLLLTLVTGLSQTGNMNNSTNNLETATLGGGCFWCTEAIFQMLPGVKSVVSGYAGGTRENPTYKEVCSGDTGHAEVIQIAYDPGLVSYEKLLETFWEAHDPTTLNRQGGDTGTQYRSIILYGNEAQKAAAEVLPGRGLPPGLLSRQSRAALLPGGDSSQGGEVRAEAQSRRALTRHSSPAQ